MISPPRLEHAEITAQRAYAAAAKARHPFNLTTLLRTKMPLPVVVIVGFARAADERA
jgi:hypothetical protein